MDKFDFRVTVFFRTFLLVLAVMSLIGFAFCVSPDHPHVVWVFPAVIAVLVSVIDLLIFLFGMDW